MINVDYRSIWILNLYLVDHKNLDIMLRNEQDLVIFQQTLLWMYYFHIHYKDSISLAQTDKEELENFIRGSSQIVCCPTRLRTQRLRGFVSSNTLLTIEEFFIDQSTLTIFNYYT